MVSSDPLPLQNQSDHLRRDPFFSVNWNIQKYSLVLSETKARIIKIEEAIGLANAGLDGAKIYWWMKSEDPCLWWRLVQDWRQPSKHREIQPNLIRRDGIQVLICLPTMYLRPHFFIKDLNGRTCVAACERNWVVVEGFWGLMYWKDAVIQRGMKRFSKRNKQYNERTQWR